MKYWSAICRQMSKSERYSADTGTIEDFKLKQHILWRKGFRLSIKLTPDFEGQYKGYKQNSKISAKNTCCGDNNVFNLISSFFLRKDGLQKTDASAASGKS